LSRYKQAAAAAAAVASPYLIQGLDTWDRLGTTNSAKALKKHCQVIETKDKGQNSYSKVRRDMPGFMLGQILAF